MARESDFRSRLASLWFRLLSLGILGLLFAECLWLAPGKAQGWTYYLTPLEVVFEVIVRLAFAAMAGIALGSFATAILLPPFWYFKSSRQRIADWTTSVAVALVVFLDSRFALTTLVKWAHHGARFKPALLVSHFMVFAVALCIPRARRELLTSLDSFLGEKATRRIALAAVVAVAALVATEFAISRTIRTVNAAQVQTRPKSNFLIITFDALNAEDMSLYGRKLPTTPNLDAFARKGTVFTNFYSASTFTTPSVATMMTGTYPSESHVYQLQGRVPAKDAERSLPHLMRAAGYATGAFLTNPYAFYLARSLGAGFDFLPEPTFRRDGVAHLWSATSLLHQDSGTGSRIDEYFDLETVWSLLTGTPNNLSMRFRPESTFEHAKEVLAQLPDGFFLWVHVVTPHNPYLPDSADRGRFLPPDKVRTFEEEFGGRWKPHYEPDQQSLLDERRLRYDEFIATADRAFGSFMSEVENSGKLRNTTVIVSADHGESFEGGIYQHSSPYLTRPVIHIPLIILTPEQQEGRRVAFAADQTALGPTILELAGLSKPEWMPGRSLVEWLNRDGQGEGEGLAFTQYLERNNVFKPLRHGKIGVIDGRYQYVLDIDTQTGALRPLGEAQIWNLDRSTENPTHSKALRKAIFSRFPFLLQKPS